MGYPGYLPSASALASARDWREGKVVNGMGPAISSRVYLEGLRSLSLGRAMGEVGGEAG